MKVKKILLCENIHISAKENLINEGFEVDLIDYAPDEEELLEILPSYDAIGIRSKTKLTKKVLESNGHLVVVGCFCIGTNQVDLVTAKRLAIPVFNAPHSNTRSVAELVISHVIALARKIPEISAKAHKGIWQKSAVGSFEIRNKTIGIVGYGHIGTQVSILAEAMGMKVLYYDITKKLALGNSKYMELDEMLASSDFVTLHVPETDLTRYMFDKKQLLKIQKNGYLINASRGTVVNIEDLVSVMEEGHLAGCAIDVFPVEPASNKEEFKSPLQGVENVILTPHIGGSTMEAQVNIGHEVSTSLNHFIKTGSSGGSTNFPELQLPINKDSSRIMNIHKNEPGVLSKINTVIAESGTNIEAQFLSTDSDVGYLVIDVHSSKAKELATSIENSEYSIKTRVVV